MKRVVGVGAVFVSMIGAAGAGEAPSFWDLTPEHLRILVAAPQVMVTRTPAGFDAYCRCPVVLRPSEIPESVKKAIISVEDRRYMDHGGVDLIALASVCAEGSVAGAARSPCSSSRT